MRQCFLGFSSLLWFSPTCLVSAWKCGPVGAGSILGLTLPTHPCSVFTYLCSRMCEHTKMHVPRGPPASPPHPVSCISLAGQRRTRFWMGLACLLRVIFCCYAPAGLPESNRAVMTSANVAPALGLVRPGLGGAQLS